MDWPGKNWYTATIPSDVLRGGWLATATPQLGFRPRRKEIVWMYTTCQLTRRTRRSGWESGRPDLSQERNILIYLIIPFYEI